MIKRIFVIFFCFSLVCASVLAFNTVDKKPATENRGQKTQRLLIFLNNNTLGSNMLCVIVYAELNFNDPNYTMKMFGDIPVAKPGTRD
jgi:hypothetical protein